MKKFLIKLAAAITALGSAVFYVLFKQKQVEKLKEDKKDLEQKAEQFKEDAKALAEQSDKLVQAITENNEVRKENEKALLDASGNHLSDFTAGLDLLRK